MNQNLGIDDQRRWARTLYTQLGKSIKEAAAETLADEETISTWVQEGSWETVRQSLHISRHKQLAKLYNAVAQLVDRMDSDQAVAPKDVDQLLKYAATIKNLDTNNSVYSIIEGAELFLEWLYVRSIPLAQAFAVEYDQFIKEQKEV